MYISNFRYYQYTNGRRRSLVRWGWGRRGVYGKERPKTVTFPNQLIQFPVLGL